MIPSPPARSANAPGGFSAYVHTRIDVVVDVVVELDDVVDVEVVGVEVVAGGVGSGALGSARSIEIAGNANGLGEQVLVPGASPFHSRVWLVTTPKKSRCAVHPEVVLAVSAPSNSPPVSNGFNDSPNSPLTVPVVPFPMT
jgi:hypothetical protein